MSSHTLIHARTDVFIRPRQNAQAIPGTLTLIDAGIMLVAWIPNNSVPEGLLHVFQRAEVMDRQRMLLRSLMLFDDGWMGNTGIRIPPQVLQNAVVFPLMDVRTITFESPDFSPYVGIGLWVGETSATATALPLFWTMVRPGEVKEMVQDVVLDWFRSNGLRLGRIPALNPTYTVQSRVVSQRIPSPSRNRYPPPPHPPSSHPVRPPIIYHPPAQQPVQQPVQPVEPQPVPLQQPIHLHPNQQSPPSYYHQPHAWQQEQQIRPPPSPRPEQTIPSRPSSPTESGPSLLDQFARIARGAAKLFEPVPMEWEEEEEEPEVQMTPMDDFEVVDQEDIPVQDSRQKPVEKDEFDTWWDEDGKLMKEDVRERIFHGGLNFGRREMWPLLLEVYPWNSTSKEREKMEKDHREEYEALKKQWKDLLSEAKEEKYEENSVISTIRDRKYRIEKDVIRTDKSMDYFHGDGKVDEVGQTWTKELDSLRDILVTFTWAEYVGYCKKKRIEINLDTVREILPEELGYCQGMADLLAPILVELDDEALAYKCYQGFMNRIGKNFATDQSGMQRQLHQLEKLIRFSDPVLYRHFNSTESGHLFFCFRWLLIWFRREFNAVETSRLWETLWTRYHANHHIFIAYAILQTYREELLECKAFDEILKCINDLSEKMNLEEILKRAEEESLRFQTRYKKWQLEDDVTKKSFHFNGPLSSDDLKTLGLEWKRSHNKIVPPGSIPCGWEKEDGPKMIIARVHQKGIFPCKAPCGNILNGAYFAQGGREVLSVKWEALVDVVGWKRIPIEWKRINGPLEQVSGVLNAEAVDEEGEPIYFCRVAKDEGMYLGYCRMGDERGATYSWGGKQLWSQEYHVLRFKSEMDWMEDLEELM